MIVRTSLLLLLEHDVEVQVLPVQSGGRKTEEGGGGGGGGGGEEEEPPKKKAKVMLLQVKKKGEPEGNRLNEHLSYKRGVARPKMVIGNNYFKKL